MGTSDKGLPMDAEVMEVLATLKAQQQADAVMLKTMLACLPEGSNIAEVWARESSTAFVDEELFAHTNTHAKVALDAFKDRMDYWGRNVAKLGDDA